MGCVNEMILSESTVVVGVACGRVQGVTDGFLSFSLLKYDFRKNTVNKKSVGQ